MVDYLYEYAMTGNLIEPDSKETTWELLKQHTLLTMGVENDIKEQLGLELINGKHIKDKHGWDGYHDKFFVEVKSETIGDGKKLSGKGIFNNITFESISKYENDKGILMFVGYSRTGQFLYSIACDMSLVAPLLKKELLKKFPEGNCSEGENTTVTITLSNLKDIPFEVVYYPMISDRSLYSEELRKVLEEGSRRKKTVCGILGKKFLSSLQECTKKPKKCYSLKEKVKLVYCTDNFCVAKSGKKIEFLENGSVSHSVLVKTLNVRFSKLLSQS